MLALLPLGRMNKRLTADLPGRQGPCSSCVAAIGVFGQLFVGHATCWSGHHDVKSSAVTCIPLRRGHPPHDARIDSRKKL